MFYFHEMELDPITKWLIRVSSSIVIAFGVTLVIVIPLVAFKASSTISIIQDIIQNELRDILTGIIAKI